MRRNVVFWILLAGAVVIGAWTTLDRLRQIGRPFAGFSVMESLLVGVGGAERGGLAPFDLVRAVDGQMLASGHDLQAAVARRPPGAVFHYILYRRGQLVEADVPSRVTTRRDFLRFLAEGLLPGCLVLGLGALVYLVKPGVAQSRLFLAFALISYLVSVTYADAHLTYRFSTLFLAAWAFWPAVFIHLALIFPQRRTVARRYPRVVYAPYVASAGVIALLLVPFHPEHEVQVGVVAGVGAAYWGLALVLLVLSLVRTSLAGATPLMRQRARVLTTAFAVGYLPSVLGTSIEAVFRVPVPYLDVVWKLQLFFPAVMAYAMARYNLFNIRTLLRIGTIYSMVTGLVVLAYAGAIAVLDLVFSSLELSTSPLVPAAVVALVVVLFLNPVYVRAQKLVDRVFFRQRFDVHRSLERVSEVMIGLLDLGRIVALIGSTVEELLHPVRHALLLHDADRGGYAPVDAEAAPRLVRADSALSACVGRLRAPLTRERLEEDPGLSQFRAPCLEEMQALGAEVVVPVQFGDRVTGLLVLGPKRSGAAYSSEDLALLRFLVNQSAVALEHAKAYSALEAVNAELKTALRRVEILESVRANLAKFVPKTVQDLIEQAPEAPELDKREADVSVLFVDIVGYTRLTERLHPTHVNDLVERYFGAFLDEILKRGGDVNETAGDGLMVIFQDADPRRHAGAAVRTARAILRRAREIARQAAAPEESVVFRVGVNSGVATVGATKIEGRTGTRWTYTASGQVTNVAARLAALGQGDEVIVGGETRRRLGEEFDLEPLGERSLRNVEQPIPIFRLGSDPSVPSLRP